MGIKRVLALVFCIILGIVCEQVLLGRWAAHFRSKLVGIFTRFKLVVMTRLISKHRSFLQFVIDFIVFWFVFLWRNGIVFQAGMDLIQPLRNEALTWSRTCSFDTVKNWDEVLVVLLYLSPYGRPNVASPPFKYALNVSTLCSFISLLLFLFVAHDAGTRCRGLKMFAGVVSGFITWYVGYAVCGLVVRIPYYYYILSAVAIAMAHLVILILIFIIWVFLGLTDE